MMITDNTGQHTYMRRKMIACRKKLGLSQTQVADAVGINRSYYANIESARNMPSYPVLRRIADVLKTKVELIVDVSEVVD